MSFFSKVKSAISNPAAVIEATVNPVSAIIAPPKSVSDLAPNKVVDNVIKPSVEASKDAPIVGGLNDYVYRKGKQLWNADKLAHSNLVAMSKIGQEPWNLHSNLIQVHDTARNFNANGTAKAFGTAAALYGGYELAGLAGGGEAASGGVDAVDYGAAADTGAAASSSSPFWGSLEAGAGKAAASLGFGELAQKLGLTGGASGGGGSTGSWQNAGSGNNWFMPLAVAIACVILLVLVIKRLRKK